MKIWDAGHLYQLAVLDNFEGEDAQAMLRFVKRCGPGYPGNEEPGYPGTTIQEVMRCIIDRLQYVDYQIRHKNNQQAIESARLIIWLLESRAAERHGRKLMATPFDEIEKLPTCTHCGHIECTGHAEKKQTGHYRILIGYSTNEAGPWVQIDYRAGENSEWVQKDRAALPTEHGSRILRSHGFVLLLTPTSFQILPEGRQLTAEVK